MIQYKKGQEVYHARFGRGIIQSISDENPPIISVDFAGETKDLVYDKNLLMRMTIRGPKNSSTEQRENKPVLNSPKNSFFSSLVLPSDIEIKQFEGMDRFHFKYKGKGFLVIDLKSNGYQLRTKEDYMKAVGVRDYEIDNMHPTNPAKIRTISYDDTTILKKLIDYTTNESKDVGINQGKAPLSITQTDSGLLLVCPQCRNSFKKAKRCPECGQLILFDAASNSPSSKRILHVGDDVSRLRIYEIINKYFGEHYNAWMKARYEINGDYWAWFPTINVNNVRPGGSYGGTAMWSNTLSPDMKTVISINHDATIDDIPKAERTNDIRRKRVLIFGRINGAFKFLGVFDDKLVLESRIQTWRHDRVATGIDLDTFKLVDED